MAAPATALGRRERFWPAVLLSAAVHAALVLVAVARAGPVLDLEQKPIAARLVKLGEARPPEWLPRKDAVPPPPAPGAPAAPASPSPGGKAPAVPGAGRAAAPGKAPSLSDVLSRVRKEVDEERWGSPAGDPMGEAAEGEAGDRYLALVKETLHANFNAPATIPEQERLHLKAVVVLHVEHDGRIARHRFERRSGNPAFDDAVERAIRQTRLPPPPPEDRERYRTNGLGANFP
jgi:colicin import membrane protein/protein TonB